MLTSWGIYTGSEVRHCEDFYIFSNREDHKSLSRNGRELLRKEDIKSLLKEKGISFPSLSQIKDQLLLDSLQRLYVDHSATESEPDWFGGLPTVVKRNIKRFIATTGEFIEPLFNIPDLPFSGFGYVVEEEGLIEATVRAFHQWRLSRVRQLGFLHPPFITDGDEMNHIMSCYGHERLSHSCDVGILLTLMWLNNRPALEGLNHHLLRLAGQAHDTLTPAGGDSTKRIDLEAFDEDKHFRELFKLPDWPALRDRFQIDEEQLVQTILNQGIFGQMLDLADKIAYTGRDVAAFLRLASPGSFVDSLFPTECGRIRELTERFPVFCGLWDSLRVENGLVYLADAKKLAIFLEIRALMFRVLYYNPASRFVEDTIANVVIRHLYQTGIVDRTSLLQMTDSDLEQLIKEVTGIDSLSQLIGLHFSAQVQRFSSLAEAIREERRLVDQQPGIFTLVSNFKPVSNSAVSKFNVKKKGKIIPFDQAYPTEARQIIDIMSVSDRAYLYSLRNFVFPPALMSTLEANRQERWRLSSAENLNLV